MRPASVARWESSLTAASGGYREGAELCRGRQMARSFSLQTDVGHRKRHFSDNPEVAGIKSGPCTQLKAIANAVAFFFLKGYETGERCSLGIEPDRRQWRMQGRRRVVPRSTDGKEFFSADRCRAPQTAL